MSNYIPGSEHGRDSAPIVYLREPLPDSYSPESAIPAGNVMMYMNFSSASAGSFSDTLANSQQPNNSINIPNIGIHDSMVVSQQEFLPSIGESRANEMNHQMMLIDQMGSRNQGLSLSLSSHIPPSGIQFHSMEYRNPNMGFSSFLSPDSGIESTRKSRRSECVIPGFHGSNLDANVSTYGIGNVSRAISDSKYLKATQQLLDEIVNVQKALKQHNLKRESMDDSKRVDGATSSNPQETNNLSAAEKQDFQNNLTKLLWMLDEVDRRYKQYYHQMQIVVSAFDVVAGCGAAKPYTTLALQTISRHFRSLRDAINGQIKVTQRSLGEADSAINGKGVGISRLRFVDQQLRQQRAFQQLGMMQQHTWRPQRGLPENSVTILRAWLFEHFLHPYPKDSDKIMLARQTGLTRSQVSNWFINARVRLWKPMVEEMYKEEAGDAEIESNSSSEVAPKNTKDDGTKTSVNKGEEDINQSAASTFNTKSSNQPHSDFQKTGPNIDDYHLFGNMNGGENERFMTASYEISELGRFGNGSGGGVSLTLGLKHCEDGSIPPMSSLGSHHHNFGDMGGGGSGGGGDGYNAAAGSSVGPGTVDFDGTESGDRQARFGSSHLLHDFVA